MSKSHPPEAVQILVVGAGPVGLFAGLSAARRGLGVLILDHVWRGYGRGHAALLHASVLRLLEEDGLAGKLRAQGAAVDSVAIHVDGAFAARVELPAPALCVPQQALEEALLAELRRRGVEVRSPHEASAISQHADHVEVRTTRRELVTLGSPAEYSEWQSVDSATVRADYVIGADGYDSGTRRNLGIPAVEVGSTETFAMFEFPHQGPTGREVGLCFTGGLGGVMLPLSGGRARWGFQLADGFDRAPDLGRLKGLLAERAPFWPDGTDRIDWGTVIHFERRLARRFGKGRVWLAGDAAHVTSPLGNHSMNVGLLEADELVERIASGTKEGGAERALDEYAVERERDWHKLLGVNVSYQLLSHAAPWVPAHARRLVPALPATGKDLTALLEQLGLRLD